MKIEVSLIFPSLTDVCNNTQSHKQLRLWLLYYMNVDVIF